MDVFFSRWVDAFDLRARVVDSCGFRGRGEFFRRRFSVVRSRVEVRRGREFVIGFCRMGKCFGLFILV